MSRSPKSPTDRLRRRIYVVEEAVGRLYRMIHDTQVAILALVQEIKKGDADGSDRPEDDN